MKSNESSLDRDLMENFYFHFVETLSILADPPAEQCAAMDYYNVAWELRSDGLDVDYLLRQGVIKFTDRQVEDMKELSAALHALSSEALTGGRDREEHLKAMSNPGWQVVRNIARKLIVTLAPRTLENRRFLKMP